MPDETKNNLPIESEDTVDDALANFTEIVSDMALPDPIKKNFIRAVDRILCALIDIPVQRLEEGPAERRAILEERIKFIRAVNAQNIQHIEADPEFARRASRTFTHRILRERLNLEKVFRYTLDIFKNKKHDDSAGQQASSESERLISEDWFNIFEKEASQKSSEDMQRRFGKVLAGEIEKPGSHSIKAIKVLGDMDQRVAMFFNTFCSLCIVNLENLHLFLKSPANFFKIRDARVPIITGSNTFSGNFQQGVGKFAQKSEAIYQRYCFGTDQFQLLLEHGLIQDVNTHTDYSHFWYNDEIWGILKPDTFGTEYQDIKISGYSLSSVGKELFHITKRSNPPGHFELLIDFLQECYTVEIDRALF